ALLPLRGVPVLHLRLPPGSRPGPVGAVRPGEVGHPAVLRGPWRHAVSPSRRGHRPCTVDGAGRLRSRRGPDDRAVAVGRSGPELQPGHADPAPPGVVSAQRGAPSGVGPPPALTPPALNRFTRYLLR